MNKDRIEGKVKDIAGRVQRQAGEWTGDAKKQVQGSAKQVEGKVQNAWGKAKDAVAEQTGKRTPSKPPQRTPRSRELGEEDLDEGSDGTGTDAARRR
jgi:uncharacterized protein YjbJ (UPF0337 family)